MKKPKKRKIKRDALLVNEKNYIYHLIEGLEEGKLRQVLIEMLRQYDYDYKMPFHQFRQWIYFLNECEKREIVEARIQESNV